jgi:hypothetical protein
MTKRRNLDRERLEVYYLHLLLAYRPIFQIGAFIVLVFSVAALWLSTIVSSVALGLAIFLVLLSYSYPVALYLAKMGAWMATVWKNDA